MSEEDKKIEEENKDGEEANTSDSVKETKEEVREKSVTREMVEALVVAFVLAVIIKTFLIEAFKIPSGSMEDTLLIGDHLMVNKFSYGLQVPRPVMKEFGGVKIPFLETQLVNTWGELKRGDIVVFRYPGNRRDDYIKRVVALEGEVVEAKNGKIHVNGVAWDDSAFAVYKYGGRYRTEGQSMLPDFDPYKVPEGHFFAMGDNRLNSSDSRVWGPAPFADIKGKAFIIYWSWDSDESSVRWSRIGDGIK